ncbi:hypothetical protein ASG39_14710 [Rhizobium sp. Leaf371]|uniref:hypothetical protein n=1 Tax=Rhizobium sp. Leaf371 TaxID=1736355 RepID=UPI00071338F2|nr:hypothetical protein [Rhizobium sp. Leaf371]KQS63176.1 hypothetical protein ASG39_14710 [Rhizobium sp. Leaf371]
MKKTAIIALCSALSLTACTPYQVRPIPGSITYNGQPRTKLTKAPIGSTFTKQITDELGCPAIETYRIEPDRSLTLLNRSRLSSSGGIGFVC